MLKLFEICCFQCIEEPGKKNNVYRFLFSFSEKFVLFSILLLYVYISVFVLYLCASSWRINNGVSVLLELKLQVVLSYLKWVLESSLGPALLSTEIPFLPVRVPHEYLVPSKDCSYSFQEDDMMGNSNPE